MSTILFVKGGILEHGFVILKFEFLKDKLNLVIYERNNVASGQKKEISLSTLNVWNVLQFCNTDPYAVFSNFSRKELFSFNGKMCTAK